MNIANNLRQRAIHRGWHSYRSRCQILRSQLGFNRVPPSRPPACVGCDHYHGRSYGRLRENRVKLICGFHPHGWLESSTCPDWRG